MHKRLSPTFISEVAQRLGITENHARKALSTDIGSGVCAFILAVIPKPVVKASDYIKVARIVGCRFSSRTITEDPNTHTFDAYLINHIKEVLYA